MKSASCKAYSLTLVLWMVLGMGGVYRLAPADIITLQSGEQIYGIAREVPNEAGKVKLTTSAGDVVVPRSRIASITEESLATGWRRIAEDHIKLGHWQEALRALDKASESSPPDPLVGQRIREVRERLAEEGLLRIEAQRAENQQRLAEVEEHIQKRQFEQAKKLLDAVAQTSPSLELADRWRKLSVSMHVGWGISREDRLDHQGAARYFREALRLDPTNQTANDHLLHLWSNEPSRVEEVIQGYEAKLAQNPNDLVVVRKLADLYISKSDWLTALPHLRRLLESGQFRGLGYEEKLFNSYSRLAADAAQAGNFERAIQLFRELLTLFPLEDPTPLHAYEYLNQLSKLEAGDYQGRIELAKFLRSKGMDMQARTDMEYVLSREPENAEALKMQRDYALQDLKEAEEHYQSGRFGMAMASARRVSETYPRLLDVVEKASDFYTRAEIELKRQQREAKARARDLVALGDTYRNDAYSYANQMKIRDRLDNVRVLDYRREAIKNCLRGLDAYQQAQRMDPEVSGMTGGDVARKMTDLQQLYRSLTAPPIPLPAWHEQRWK